MMDFIDKNILAYAEEHSSPEPSVLKELNQETTEHIPGSQMLSGYFQGRFLGLISRILQPQNIVELGTYTGYSAICLSEGLPPGGKVHTIDNNPQHINIATKYFRKAHLEHSILLHLGHGLDILPHFHPIFDLAFIDADKKNYPRYYELIMNILRPNGIILIDNTLWSGKVLEEDKDEKTKAIDEVNKKVRNDERVEKILLPIRDGLMIAQKLN